MRPCINLDGGNDAVRAQAWGKTAPLRDVDLRVGLDRLFERLNLPVRCLSDEMPAAAVARCHAYLDCLQREADRRGRTQ